MSSIDISCRRVTGQLGAFLQTLRQSVRPHTPSLGAQLRRCQEAETSLPAFPNQSELTRSARHSTWLCSTPYTRLAGCRELPELKNASLMQLVRTTGSLSDPQRHEVDRPVRPRAPTGGRAGAHCGEAKLM
jgi:hypothetical protein